MEFLGSILDSIGLKEHVSTVFYVFLGLFVLYYLIYFLRVGFTLDIQTSDDEFEEASRKGVIKYIGNALAFTLLAVINALISVGVTLALKVFGVI